jgi:hypothetical protein
MRLRRDVEREAMPFVPARRGVRIGRAVRAPQIGDFDRDGRVANGGRGIVGHSVAYTAKARHQPFIHSGDKRFE